MSKEVIVIVTIKSFHIKNASKLQKFLNDEFEVIIITQKEDLNFCRLNEIKPKFIFFPHWSWIISKDIYSNFNCIVFHMTDLPYGRGGSPLQNLIINKVYQTKISAIRVEEGLDTGKVYLKEDFYVGLGSADEILQRISEVVFFKMIPFVLYENPKLKEQVGNIKVFQRRKPEQSDLRLNDYPNLNDLYDFIRMLDGEGYPKAYLNFKDLNIEFFEARIGHEKLFARVLITKRENNDE